MRKVICSLICCISFMSAIVSCSEGPLDGGNDSVNGGGASGVGQESVHGPITMQLSSVTATTAVFTGSLDMNTAMLYTELGIIYSTDSALSQNNGTKVRITELINNKHFTQSLTGLPHSSKIYYAPYYRTAAGLFVIGEVKSFDTPDPYVLAQRELDIELAKDLSITASANTYVVSKSGLYKFRAVKGNSKTSVGNVCTGDILWETFGTQTLPNPCDLITSICYKDCYIAFQTNDTFKKGNAVVSAKDKQGNILWSWHLWFTDEPQEQVYFSGDVLMDRNLGATSFYKGDVCSLGLLYQWGRKDPFLNAGSILNATPAAESTIIWPKPVKSDSEVGTIEYSVANPTTYIFAAGYDYDSGVSYTDWYFTRDGLVDNTRWGTMKTIYDPCPVGWKVPPGGENDVWERSSGISQMKYTYDSRNLGMNFLNVFCSGSVWYPMTGQRDYDSQYLNQYGFDSGSYWTVTPYNEYAFAFTINTYDWVTSSSEACRAYGFSVRCQKE